MAAANNVRISFQTLNPSSMEAKIPAGAKN